MPWRVAKTRNGRQAARLRRFCQRPKPCQVRPTLGRQAWVPVSWAGPLGLEVGQVHFLLRD